MTEVLWVSHFPFSDTNGGAEMADRAMMAEAPESVTVTAIHPQEVFGADLTQFDAVVVTGTEGLTEDDRDALANVQPVMWAHRNQDMFPDNKSLYEACSLFIALTPQHLERESSWLDLKNTAINPGYFDTTDCHIATKQNLAIWPHRDIPHKGLPRALEWSKARGVPLMVMTDRPRRDVLEAMSVCRFMVLISEIFDAGPWSVMEAQLSGCQIVVNPNVGWFDESRAALEMRIQSSGQLFWGAVLDPNLHG